MTWKVRAALLVCLLLGYVCPAAADVQLPASLVVVEEEAFMDAFYLSGHLDIPEGVTTIEARAFSGCTRLTSVSIPSTVRSIGAGAFQGCSGLTGTLTLPENATVAADAFEGCAGLTFSNGEEEASPARLFEYTISGGEATITDYHGNGSTTALIIPSRLGDCPVTAIGDYAFAYSTRLQQVKLPATLRSIGSYAFAYCTKLEQLTLPCGVKNVKSRAFYYCTALESTLELMDAEVAGNAFTACRNATVYLYTTHENGLTLTDCRSSQTALTLPGSFGGRSVTAIGSNAFDRLTTLQRISLPASVTSIGSNAFYFCTSLQSVELPAKLVSIGESAFSYCTALESMNLPCTVRTIGAQAFSRCSKLGGEMHLLDVAVGDYAFYNCDALTVFTYHAENGGARLVSCSGGQGEMRIPAQIGTLPVTALTRSAFTGCSVTSLTLPNTLGAICDGAFTGCTTLETINIPASVTAIGEEAFRNCTALGSVTLHEGVRTVGKQAFMGCTGLTTLTVQGSGTQLGQQAFCDCTKLASIHLPSGFRNIGNYTFNNTPWLQGQVNSLAVSITAGCTGEFEKALALHDWIVLNTVYDVSSSYNGVEGLLFHGTGVCNSYTMTYRMMLNAVGIGNRMVTGTATDRGTGVSGSHAWNLVRLDGDWYHIDCTWDDPVPDGNERYSYFGLNDERMSRDHTWDTDSLPAANGTRYAYGRVNAVTADNSNMD